MPNLAWWQPSPKSAGVKPIPWLAPAVIQYLENIIEPDFEVLEHGSGGSTLWFAERVKRVAAIENNIDWLTVVKEKAPENVFIDNYIFPDGPYDLLLIDGEPVEARASWLRNVPQMVKPGGWIVLDNANRPEYEAERETLRQYADLVETFDSNEGVTLYLVTDFYRMKGATDESRTEPEPAGNSRKNKKGSSRSRNASA